MREQVRIFFTALMFYTRIPCPKEVDHSPEYINKATRYFPLIGWIVGSISFLAYWIISYVFGMQLAVLFSLVVGVLLTGAFHEDGFADVFDGFGGGWSKEKILEIMKDSRIGAFGAIALIFLFSLKFLALHSVLISFGKHHLLFVSLLFIAYHALARFSAICLAFTSEYARDDELSKAKPIAKSHSKAEVIGASFFGLLPIVLLSYFHWQMVFVVFPLILLVLYARSYFQKWIGGYTGDCLGALEQASECLILLTWITLAKIM